MYDGFHGVRLTRTRSYKRKSSFNYAGFCYAKVWTNQRGLKISADSSDWLAFQGSISNAEKSFIGSGLGCHNNPN